MKPVRVADTFLTRSCYDRVEEACYTAGLNPIQAWRSLIRSWRTHGSSRTISGARRTLRGWSQERAGPAVGAVARRDQRHRDRPAHPFGRGRPGLGRGAGVPGRGPVSPAPSRTDRAPVGLASRTRTLPLLDRRGRRRRAALPRRSDPDGGDPPRRRLSETALARERADRPATHPGDGLLRSGRRPARRRARPRRPTCDSSPSSAPAGWR